MTTEARCHTAGFDGGRRGQAPRNAVLEAFGKGSDTDSPLELWRASVTLAACVQSPLNFWPPGVRENICITLNHQVCGSLLQQPEETNTVCLWQAEGRVSPDGFVGRTSS